METIPMRRRWRWTEHVLRKKPDNITCGTLHLTLEGKRKREGHLAKNCGGTDEDPQAQQGHHLEASPYQTREKDLCCCPTC